MNLFDTVEGKHPQYLVDTLYNPPKFSRQHTMMRKILTRSVIRKGMSRIPPCVKQKELNSNTAKIYTRGKAKASVMKWDTRYNKLIEVNVYDTNPVHYIIMV